MLKVKNKMYLHLQSMVRGSFECMDAVRAVLQHQGEPYPPRGLFASDLNTLSFILAFLGRWHNTVLHGHAFIRKGVLQSFSFLYVSPRRLFVWSMSSDAVATLHMSLVFI